MSFSEWFEKQFGKRPTWLGVNRLKEQISDLEHSLMAKRAVLGRLEKWEMKRTAALYAWQAREALRAEGDGGGRDA